MHALRRTIALLAAVAAGVSMTLGATAGHASSSTRAFPTPIRHVVILYQENHSFNEVLGVFCQETGRCSSATQGLADDGTVVPLHRAPDIVPPVGHGTRAQVKAMDGGSMDGFSLVSGCQAWGGYQCYERYRQKQIPNLARLARNFAISN